MYLTCDYQVDIDIQSCIVFFTNLDENLLERLHKDYDGICYGGNLIIRVIRVLRRGECFMNSPTNPTVGSMSVMFRALVVNYSPGDLIAGCTIYLIREHGRITMASLHANAMIIQTSADPDVAVLNAGAIIAISATGTLASPGANRISIQARLFEPSATTRYYPIIAGSVAQLMACEAMTRETFIQTRSIAPLLRGEELADDAIQGVSVIVAARSAADFARETMQQVGAKHTALPNIIRKLFYPYRQDRNVPDLHQLGFDVINLLEPHIPDNASCLVMCSEMNPLDEMIGVITAPLAELPKEWIQGELAQPAGVVLARRLERFIDFAIAGATMAREFMDDAKITASKNIIALQTSKKT